MVIVVPGAGVGAGGSGAARNASSCPRTDASREGSQRTSTVRAAGTTSANGRLDATRAACSDATCSGAHSTSTAVSPQGRILMG